MREQDLPCFQEVQNLSNKVLGLSFALGSLGLLIAIFGHRPEIAFLKLIPSWPITLGWYAGIGITVSLSGAILAILSYEISETKNSIADMLEERYEEHVCVSTFHTLMLVLGSSFINLISLVLVLIRTIHPG